MRRKLLKNIVIVFVYILSPVILLVLCLCALIGRLSRSKTKKRLFFGDEPLINFSYYKKAIENDYPGSKSFVSWVMPINKKEDWDIILTDKFWYLPKILNKYVALGYALIKFDVFITGVNGIFIGKLPLRNFQKFFLIISGKKIVVLPYGSDAYIYRRISAPRILHALQISYPEYARQQKLVQENVDYWVRYADIYIPGIMGADGYGRWDILTPSHLFIDTDKWKPNRGLNNAASDAIKIVHTPNHRGVKGTEYVVNAVKKLLNEGYNVELVLIEGKSNQEVHRLLSVEADILVEQLNGYGYALSGIEGMACGVAVISSPQDHDYVSLLKSRTFLSECPIICSSTDEIYQDIKRLLDNPTLLKELGILGRSYVEKYHGYDAARIFFQEIFRKLDDPQYDIISLFDPINGKFVKELADLKASKK